MRPPSRAAFTLIELLVVIAIIGILAAVLVPNMLGSRAQAYDSGALNCAKRIQDAQTTYNGKNFEYATDLTELNTDMIAGCGLDSERITIVFGTADGTQDTTFTHADGDRGTRFQIHVWDTRGSTRYAVTESTVRAVSEL